MTETLSISPISLNDSSKYISGKNGEYREKEVQQISSDFEEIPEAATALEYKRMKSEEQRILPEGAINMKDKTWIQPAFHRCLFREGYFFLTHDELGNTLI